MPSLEETLFQALEDERKLSEERALLPGLLQHDLANVLCQVSLAASMAGIITAEDERARYLRDVEGGVKRMSDLLTGMRFLFLTREGSSDYGRGDLAGFVRNLVEEPGVWPPGAPITLALPPSMWCAFSPTLVRHALVNLIGNAVAYSRGTWVRVRLAQVSGTLWQLAIANGGPGIPANHKPYLFEMGPAVKQAEKIGDTHGLGLYIARMCVRLHGATLRVRTREGLTVFSFGIKGAQRERTAPGIGAANLCTV
jgi:two-component system sensor histidine kinase CreC